ncbi:type IV secretory system conjugative DNA transfer family protein [Solirubrobacter ginsenosidimutans]|uniref:Type IV secretory system conjugative DNA transfer family protein n=1 Tax=Solirubrobacter ginsenosidimutans TaxID=490573 RepID=A0A9X3MSX7_9ACTN|nr:type IV secretory system conjugative DNA transfer family protein [Solirubrobacter ginsenosidimutans]MDA0161261.1 type IV secretory system conjugative DNA transfer family protein [Solirubrobacter ginsenosidimutans]
MNEHGGAAHELNPLEIVFLGLAAVVAVLGGVGWLVGSTAGLVFAGGWPHLGLADSLAALLELPSHLSDPRGAWPVDVRDRLPGAMAMYASAFVVAAVIVALGLRVSVRWSRRDHGPAVARWATNHQLHPLLATRPQPARVTLGRRGRFLVCCEPLHSTLVIAPTQTGKTTGLAIPAILEWRGPVLATSVKTDLLRDTIEARKARGRVQLFDPAGSTGLKSSAWTPLAGCESWAGARRTAAWLAEGASANKRGLADADFWYSTAAKLLAPMFFAAVTSGRTIGDVIAWLDTQEEAEIMDALVAAEIPSATHAFEASIGRDIRQRSSVYATAETILEAYADPGVLLRSKGDNIRPDELLDGGQNTLYLSATVREQRRLRPVFVALLESVIEEAYTRSAATGEPLDPPLLVVLDEAANIAPLPDLDVIAATGAGHGVQLVTVLQDLAQAHDRWGRDRADTIVNNHRARVIGGGIADERTLEYVGKIVGDTEVRQQSSTSAEQGRHSTTTSTTYRSLAPANSLREAKRGSALLLYGSLPPARIAFRPWYTDRALSTLARGRTP